MRHNIPAAHNTSHNGTGDYSKAKVAWALPKVRNPQVKIPRRTGKAQGDALFSKTSPTSATR
jgi:hypothetical protein